MTGLSTTTYQDSETQGVATRDPRDSARAFRRAARHSRWVRLLRVALPLTIVLTLGATIFVVWLDPMRLLVRLPGDPGKLVISGTKITMQAPKLSGFTRDQRAYDVSARAATQDVTNPNIVELHGVRAKVDTADKGAINIAAEDGHFDRKANMLTLSRDVNITTGNGAEMRLEEVVVNTVAGTIVSNKPVKVTAEQATIDAARLEVTNSGEVIRFTGNVVMTIAGAALPNRPTRESGQSAERAR